MYDDVVHIGIVKGTESSSVQVRCLVEQSRGWWKLEPEDDAVWYEASRILGRAEKEPQIDRRGDMYEFKN